MILVIFAVSGMLNNNFTQIYVLQNTLNLPASQVIDTYVYQTGLKEFQFACSYGDRFDEIGVCACAAAWGQHIVQEADKIRFV